MMSMGHDEGDRVNLDLDALRRVAEAAIPFHSEDIGPQYSNDPGVLASAAFSNTFNPSLVLSLLDEVARGRRER